MENEKRLPTNLTLTLTEKEILKEIGEGNMSKGVKKLIALFQLKREENN